MRCPSTTIISACACAFVLTVGVAAQNPGGNPDAKKMKNPVASSPESIKAGQALYQKNCRFCHGTDAKGNGPMAPEGTHPSNLVDAKWDRGDSDGEIFVVIRDGLSADMLGYKDKLKDAEMWQVVVFVRTLAAKKTN